jgi:phosphatidylinositol glycan class Q protein
VHLWTRLSAHYSPLRLVRCLVRGEFVTPIARWSIRYGRETEESAVSGG